MKKIKDLDWVGPATFLFGLFVGLTVSFGIAFDDGADLVETQTSTGLSCVILDRLSTAAISCNWDDHNFLKYHGDEQKAGPTREIPI